MSHRGTCYAWVDISGTPTCANLFDSGAVESVAEITEESLETIHNFWASLSTETPGSAPVGFEESEIIVTVCDIRLPRPDLYVLLQDIKKKSASR